jgi:adenosylmethionine-8-amino-7-oxononanoate aminotransferase
MKLARQYHLELSPGSPRVKFIARRGSWHGCTLATLSLGDFKPRKEIFDSMFHDNVTHVSPCHPYRDLREGESSEEYVARLAQELEDEFQRLGPKTVCAFVVEPMVGTVSFRQSNLELLEVRANQIYLGPWLRGSLTWIFEGHERYLSPSRRSSGL